MKLHHRHSFFPLVLGLLTLGLIVLMFYAFAGRRPSEATPPVQLNPVSTEEYEKSLQTLMSSFVVAYDESADDLSRLVLVEQTLTNLLALRVPAEEKQTHLELAVGLNQMQQALRAKNGEEKKTFEWIKTSYVSN